MSIARRGEVVGGRYLVEEPIGRGANASVFRARDQTLARTVAIKFLYVHDERRRDWFANRFLREARIAASVDHANVVRTHDFGTHGDRPYMVMALLEGEHLGERLARDPPPSLGEIVDLACEVLAGLDAVHRAGIVHRDLKPENVILVRDGAAVRPKIVDFGVSRAVQPMSEVRSALTTRDGLVVGTPEYMSPEQARGEGQVDARADLYAVGVVLYEALTGSLPYRAPHVADLIVAITEGGAPSVHELRPELSPALSDVIARAMALDPDARWSSAAEMAQALLDATGRRPTGAAGGSWLPGHAEQTPTLSEFRSRPPEALATSPTALNPSGTVDFSTGEVERALADAKVADVRPVEASKRPPPPPSDALRSVSPGPSVSPRSLPLPASKRASGLPIDTPATRALRGEGARGGRAERAERTAPRAEPTRGERADATPLSLPVPPAGASVPIAARLPSAHAEAGRESISLPPVSRTPAAGASGPPRSRPPVMDYQDQLAYQEELGRQKDATPSQSLRTRRATPSVANAPLRPRRATPSGAQMPLEIARATPTHVPRVGVARSMPFRSERRGSRVVLWGAVLAALFVGAFATRHPLGREVTTSTLEAIARVVPWLGKHLPLRRTVQVTLLGVPQRALIRLDGLPIGVDSFEVRRDGALHLVEVLAAGRAPWQGTFEAHRDVTFHVVLAEPERRARMRRPVYSGE